MSVTNNALLFVVGGNLQGTFTAELVPGPAATQNTATRINSPLTHVLKSVSTGSLQLPSILNGEANELMWVVNDTGVTVNVYPAAGEKTNGNLNTAFAVTANISAVFVPVLNSTLNYPSTLDWRCTLVP
jgi:hypothetical protein